MRRTQQGGFVDVEEVQGTRADESEQTFRLANVLRRLNRRSGLPPLLPEGEWHPGIDEELSRVSVDWLSGGRAEGAPSAVAYIAALHLWNDSLDRAHRLVEKLGTPTGNWLHGMVHRREGDFDNANYWFRETAFHPAYHGLQARASAFLRRYPIVGGPIKEAADRIATQGSWNPYLFVAAAAMQAGFIGDDDARDKLEYVQQLELEAALRYLEGNLGALRED